MTWEIFVPGLVSLGIAVLGMPVMIWIAQKIGFVDDPEGRESWRRLQKKPVANGGGIVLWLAFVIGVLLFFEMSLGLWMVLLGGLILVAFGTWDDARDLNWKWQLVPQFLAAGLIIWGGIRINFVTNPFGGTWDLTLISWVPIVLTGIWTVGMINTTKLLDGVDGLLGGVGLIASLILAGLSLMLWDGNVETAKLALILAGGLAGFLVWNWHPAKIFLGESGATLIGFLLAVLAIFSGGKIATAFLVMGLPILDVVRLIVMRVMRGKKPWEGGRDHLHHLLHDAGFGVRGTVVIILTLALGFGLGALVLKTQGKLILAGVVFLVLMGMSWGLERMKR